MHNIVFLDSATIAPHIVLRRPGFEHSWTAHPATAPMQVLGRLQEADIAVINKIRLDAETLGRLPRLKMIAIAATGYDCVDVAAAQKLGIAVANIRGYAVNTVPEHTFALILALRRRLLPYARDVVAGEWQKAGQFCFFNHEISDLHGAQLGIAGSGAIGGRVAQIGEALGMKPVFAGRKGAPASGGHISFDDMIATSDVISLHCPLTPQTRNLIGWPEFQAMRRRPILINTARGGLIDENALERALDAGLAGGAGLDVTSPEPPPADSTIMRLARRDDMIVTPHVGWASTQAQQTLADQLIDNIEAFVAGRSANRLA
jgi:glycerate dehydrogenase